MNVARMLTFNCAQFWNVFFVFLLVLMLACISVSIFSLAFSVTHV